MQADIAQAVLDLWAAHLSAVIVSIRVETEIHFVPDSVFLNESRREIRVHPTAATVAIGANLIRRPHAKFVVSVQCCSDGAEMAACMKEEMAQRESSVVMTDEIAFEHEKSGTISVSSTTSIN